MRVSVLLVLLAACGEDPCPPMCAASREVYGTCLEEWGLDWQAAGYLDADDFEGRCTTWAWELRLLAADAGQPGRVVDAECSERLDTWTVPGASCSSWTAVDWTALPWE